MVYSTSKKLFIDLIIRGVLSLVIMLSAWFLYHNVNSTKDEVAIHQQRIQTLVDLQNTWIAVGKTTILKANTSDSVDSDAITAIQSQLAEKKMIITSLPQSDNSFIQNLAKIDKDIDLLSGYLAGSAKSAKATTQYINKLSDHALTALSTLLGGENDILSFILMSNGDVVNIFIYVIIGLAFWLFLLNLFVYFTSVRKLKEHENRIEEVVNSQQVAQLNEDAKTEYMAMISHEIRTPMNGVLGMSNLLLGSSLNEEQKEYATSIHHSTEKLLRTVNDVLDYSMLEADKVVLNNGSSDVRQVINEVISLYPVANKTITISSSVSDKVPQLIWTDSMRLRQILSVFMSNATKFTEAGSIVIQCDRIEKFDNEEFKIGFKVVDTGIGIGADRIERLFEPFLAVGRASVRKYTGNGMGLFIARRLVELMGGKVKVESEVGKGTTFSFFILTRLASPESQKESSTLSSSPSTANQPVNIRTITPVIDTQTPEAVELASSNSTLIEQPQTEDEFSAQNAFGAILAESEAIRTQSEPVKIVSVENLRDSATADTKELPLEVNLPTTSPEDIELRDNFPSIEGTYQEAIHTPTITRIDMNDEKETPAPPSLNILAVDDNEINLMLISKSLQKIGYQCKKATNGEQAVEMVKQEKFDLIFMDMQMPIMDGTDATTEIRKHYRIFEYPVVIALTANAIGDGREKCLEAGMQDFITKPFKPAQIEEIIQEWAPKIAEYREKFGDIVG